MQHITRHYPQAKPLFTLKHIIIDELKKRQLAPKQCIWGTSICSDEVNNTFNFLNHRFVGPGAFRFGGISGLPFTGKTGYKAFASHIPENGGAFIVYGPHIGISKEGTVGEIAREGQSHHTTCCGSIITGLGHIKSGNVLQVSHDDYQQSQVNRLFTEHLDKIQSAENKIKAVTDIVYAQIEKELKDIITACKEHVGSSPVILIGGIIINTDYLEEDYFALRDIAEY